MEKFKFLSDAQLKSEVDRCLFCQEKPCLNACPVSCSPADFIMAVKVGERSDFKKAAKIILGSNPLGGVCGVACPDKFCVEACSRNKFDKPIEIPKVQATIIQKAKDLNIMPKFEQAKLNGKKVAIVGSGPSGLACASVLAQMGYEIDIYEKEKKAGGAISLIPEERLPKKIFNSDLDFIKSLGKINFLFNKNINEPENLLKNYNAVLVATGVEKQLRLNIKNEDKGIDGLVFLRNLKKYSLKNKNVAIIGGGAVSADCALTALKLGAKKAEIYTRKNIKDIDLPKKELEDLLQLGININAKSRITEIIYKNKIKGIKIIRLDENSKDIKGTEQNILNIDFVVLAIKNIPILKENKKEGLFYSGDFKNGSKTIVESVASGKNIALEIDAYLNDKKIKIKNNLKSEESLKGKNMLPVSLETSFFGIKMSSPFLISAAPHSDGYEEVKKAYQAGWAGVIMKTAFDGLDIHIPSEYMFKFTPSTYGNSDNVSGHSLNRVCEEIKRLKKEFPDKLTGASTGGPVTGNDEEDKKVWQKNTKKLEEAGSMIVEYSLSCPQGGDGTKGDIVSQDRELAAKVVNWVMEISNPEIPKLFKLTGAVTSIYQIVEGIKEVLNKYPNKKAGITLANSFPAIGFRKSKNKVWDEAIVVGLSGEGVAPISNLTIAKASKLDVVISGNGGAMNYKMAANFLAMGAGTVQFCTLLMKNGYQIINELKWGLSHMLEEKGFKSVKDLISCSKPDIITDFMKLTPIKKIPDVKKELCTSCGNCTTCGYLAVTLNKKGYPEFDPSKCVGCSICAQKCFAGALYMRERTNKEKEALKEG